MSARRTRRWISAAGTLACLAPLFVSSGGAAAEVPPESSAPSEAAPWREEATTDDHDAAAAADAPSSSRLDATLAATARTTAVANVTVEILGEDAAIIDAVGASGGTLGRGGSGLYLATVSSSRLRSLAATPGIQQVREPAPMFVPGSEPSPKSLDDFVRLDRGPVSNVASDGIQPWLTKGYTGSGTKVGIIGLFDTTALATQISSGELPAIPAEARTCVSAGAACPFGTPGQTWGNSLAEIVADGAPGAALYLAELGARSDYYAVVDWMAANGVTMLINPIVWTYDGPGNGTGPSAAIVDYAVGKGIAWFNLAGEMGQSSSVPSYKGSYWKGAWKDNDNDRWLNFTSTDETMSVYCGFLLGLRWSDWAGVPTDYDLYISDYKASSRTNGTVKLLSGNVQSSAGALPLEATTGVRLCNTNSAYGPVYDTNQDGFVSLWVQRKKTSPAASATNDVLEIGAYYGWLEHSTADGSVTMPFADSANPGEITVGSIEESWIYGGVAASTGPTNDGRIKPDVVQTMCVTTSLDGPVSGGCTTGYFGTDGAAAIVVGWAAVVHSALDVATPQGLALYLRDNVYGFTGNTKKYGYGRFALTASPPPAGYEPSRLMLGSPQRIVDTRIGVGVAAAGPLAPGQTIRVVIPPSAMYTPRAAVLNIAVVNAASNGWISVFPHSWSYAGATSVLNVDVGQNKANLVVVPPGPDGVIDVYSNAGGHLVIDQVGLMVAEGSNGEIDDRWGSGRLRPMDPFRLVDTRTCAGLGACNGQPLAAASYTSLTLRGVANPSDPANAIPDDATAVALSLTVDSPSARGYASVLPGNQTTVATSNINFEPGKSATTMVLAPISGAADGKVNLFLSQSAHVQVDVLGWFTGLSKVGEPWGMYVPVTPVRALDTRQGGGTKPEQDQHVSVDVGATGLPADAIAVLVDNVSVASTAPGEVQASAQDPGPGRPYRNLTYSAVGRPIASSTITSLHDGSFVLTPSAPTHLVTDVLGYFLPAANAPPPEGAVSLLTLDAEGTPADDFSTIVGVSPDGEAMLFTSPAANLGGPATPTTMYLWTEADGIQLLPYGLTSGDAAVTPDGSTVLYWTYAALLPADTDAYEPDLYTYDVATGVLTFHDTPGVYGRARLSYDGTTFIVVHDWSVSTIDLTTFAVTVRALPAGFTSFTLKARLSDDGRYVVKVENCAVVRGDLHTGTSISQPIQRCPASVGTVSVDASIVLTSTGSPADAPYGEVVLPGTATPSMPVSAPAKYGYLAVPSASPIGGGRAVVQDTDSGLVFFVDVSTGVLTPISLTEDGTAADRLVRGAVLSADGRWLFVAAQASNITPDAPYGGIYRIDLDLY